MPQFPELNRVLDDVLELPVPNRAGTVKVYRIPPMSGKNGLFAQRMMNLVLAATVEEQRPRDLDKPDPPARELPAPPVLEGQDEQDFYDMVLGRPLLDEMLADEVTWPMIQHVSLTAFTYNTADAESAQAYWVGGGRGKVLQGRPGSRATARSASRGGPSTTQASRKGHKKAKSRGGGSSSTGR